MRKIKTIEEKEGYHPKSYWFDDEQVFPNILLDSFTYYWHNIDESGKAYVKYCATFIESGIIEKVIEELQEKPKNNDAEFTG